jgi:Ni,Fe-hydrogenase III component G
MNETRLPGVLPAWFAEVEAGELRAIARKCERLVALWASDEQTWFCLHVALASRRGLLWLKVPLAREHPRYPGIADLFPPAGRMQRAAYDLVGVHAEGGADHRKWLRHGAWPAGTFPLRKDFDASARHEPAPDHYPFVRVEGEGVHEIGQAVHAGTIEPGHFRFSIVGETILKLEERLGYKHKGVEKRFEALGAREGARLAGRISGDSTVAYAWAYALALEAAAGIEPPARAVTLRHRLGARARREPPRRPRLPGQRRRAVIRLLPVLAAQGDPASDAPGSLRPPLPDGLDLARWGSDRSR